MYRQIHPQVRVYSVYNYIANFHYNMCSFYTNLGSLNQHADLFIS